LQEKIKAFMAARGSGDPQAWQARLQELRQHWSQMSPDQLGALQRDFPQLAERMNQLAGGPRGLAAQGALVGPAGRASQWQGAVSGQSQGPGGAREGTWWTTGTHTGPQGRTQTYDGTVTHRGQTWQQQGTWTGPGGQTVEVQGTRTREGSTTTTHKTWRGEGGKTASFQGQTTVDGNQAAYDRSWTGPQGRTTTVTGTTVKNGSTFTSDKTYTTPDGQTRHVTGQTTVDGGSVNSAWTTDRGKTVTHQADRQVEGGLLTTDHTWTGPQGQAWESSGDWMFDFLNAPDAP
jgi:hypothetical protein